ncbi:MAG: ABC transporter permease [Paenirhodobacter sp.]|uniref:ABC transporter permease n=1 Tax=Paenirhodobacter sp. TaxID=1965326 RepID=UPI003D11BD26
MSASPFRKWARSEAVNGYMMVSPTLIYAILLLAAPLVTLVAYSFFTDGYLVVIPELTTANYTQAWSDPIFRTILLRSVIVSALVTLVTVVLAFPIAYFISFHVPASKKSRWLFLITIPFWTSYLIRVFQWKVILNYNGVINSILTGLGITDHPLQMLNSIGAISITLAHAYAPFAILPIFVSLEKIDRSLLEAGLDLGENRLMTFLRVTLPLAMPGVIGAVMIVFIPTIGDYVTPELIGGGKLPMVANVIYQQLLKIDNKPLGSAMAISAMLVVAAVALLFLFLNRRFLRGSK